MIDLAKSYMPPIVLVVWALLIIAGAPREILAPAFLLAEAVALFGYIHWVRDRFDHFDEHHHPMRRHDDHD